MAEQLSLVRGYDFESDQGTVSLISNTDGFDVAYQGWTPKVSADRKGMVSQALTLRVQGTSTDTIAASLQKLSDMAVSAQRYYTDGVENYAVWFRVQLDGETKGRQTLVQELRHEPATSVYDYAMRQKYHVNRYTVGITHYPWWEGTAIGTVTASSVSIFGGTFSYGTVYGDLPARLARVKMQPVVGAVAGSTPSIWPSGQFWLGFRSNRYSSTPSAWVSWFRPIKAGGAVIPDTTAFGGTAIRHGDDDITYDNYDVGRGWMGTITAGTPAHMYGEFIVLAHAKLMYGATADWSDGTSSLAWNIHLATGFSNDVNTGIGQFRNTNHYPRVAITKQRGTGGTTETTDGYKFYELGRVQFPPVGRYPPGVDWSQYSLYILADQIDMTGFAGTAYLYIDGLAFIPTEGLYWGGEATYDGKASNPSDGTIAYYGYNTPSGDMDAIIAGTAGAPYVYGASQPYYSNGVPVGTGIGVMAANGNVVSDGTAVKANMELRIVERWESLRGNE